MVAYIITYDLRSPGRDYNDLYDRIKSYNRWAFITESSWAVSTDHTAVAVRDYLTQALDSNDKLFVGQLGASAWIGLPSDVSKWLKDNL